MTPRLLNYKFLPVILLLIAGWLGMSVARLHIQRQANDGSVRDLEKKLSSLQENNHYLASSSDYFKSNAYLEREARIKLNYKLSDEEVAFVYKDASKSMQLNFADKLKQASNLKKWWLYVLGY